MTARIVIIGGGQAGGWAAKTLRDEGYDGEICVVAEEEWIFTSVRRCQKRRCWRPMRRCRVCSAKRCSRR